MQADEALVKRALDSPEGDTLAFAELVRRHQAKVLANCRHLTRSPDDAEDLAQEVFVKAFFKLATFEQRARFGTWLQRIKVNHCLNFMKARKGRKFLDAQEPSLAHEPELQVSQHPAAQAEEEQERARIRAVLDSLPDPLRIPLVLCDVDGLSYKEIQEQLGIGLSATKMRIARARDEFRRRHAAMNPIEIHSESTP